MKQVVPNLYTINELSEAARCKALEWYRLNRATDFDCELVHEEFQEILAEKGYPTDRLYWSLSHCQGDGVAFYGVIQDPVQVMQRVCPELYGLLYVYLSMADGEPSDAIYNDFLFEIVRTGSYHYNHYNTMGVWLTTYDDNFPDEVSELLKRITAAIEEDVKETSRYLEKLGYDELEYLESDENLLEELRNNDFLFTVDGQYYPMSKTA